MVAPARFAKAALCSGSCLCRRATHNPLASRTFLWRRAAVYPSAASSVHSVRLLCSSMEALQNSHCLTRVLFCGLQFPTSFGYTKEYLQPHSYIQVDAMSHDEVPCRIEDYDLCVVRMMSFDSSVIARAKRLKLLMQFGVGLEGVDIESATKAGIKVARIPGDTSGNALSCAEHAIYLILALLRDEKTMKKSVQQMQIGVPTGQTIFGKTVFILGYGNIGKELAARLKPFGVRILALKRTWRPNDAADLVDEKGTDVQLLDFASKADIVVLCCSLTPETVGIVNCKFLTALKKGAYIVNVGRGGLLDYVAINAALQAKHLGGLATDVAWFEPFDPADPVLEHSNVILTPHIAGVTEFAYKNMAQVVANAALHLHKGKDVMSIKGIEIVN